MAEGYTFGMGMKIDVPVFSQLWGLSLTNWSYRLGAPLKDRRKKLVDIAGYRTEVYSSGQAETVPSEEAQLHVCDLVERAR